MKRTIRIAEILVCITIIGICIGKIWLGITGQKEISLPIKPAQDLYKRVEEIRKKRFSIKSEVSKEPIQIILLGTIVDHLHDSVAWLKDIPSGYGNYYKIGDKIKDSVVIKIEAGNVELLRKDGTIEILRIKDIESSELTREDIASQYENPNNILKEIRITPDIADGRIRGFKLSHVEKNSIVEQVGFKQGDVITQINGCRLTNPKDAIRLYDSLREEYNKGMIKPVEIEFERDGKPQRVIYSIR